MSDYFANYSTISVLYIDYNYVILDNKINSKWDSAEYDKIIFEW